jgi:hypothetical protein
LCFGANDVGYRECETLLGGTFVSGASCPSGALEGTLCVGVCCLDDDMLPGTPVVCTIDTRYQECCLGNGAVDQSDPSSPDYLQGQFLGYAVGDTPLVGAGPDTYCDLNANACDPTGSCCNDSAAGYVCTENQLEVDCTGGGGTYGGDDSTCATAPCPDAGSCCVGASCSDGSSPLHCAGLGGTYQGDGSDCGSVVCAGDPTGACCFACPDGLTCTPSLTAADCKTVAKGIYAGDASTCSAVCDNYCIGDLDGDGATNVGDFPLFAGMFGMSVPLRCNGDLNCDGVVNVGDFPLFAGGFGCSKTPHTSCP